MSGRPKSSDQEPGSAPAHDTWRERMRSRGGWFDLAYNWSIGKALGRMFDRVGYPDEVESERIARSSNRQKLALLRDLGSDERVVLKVSPSPGGESILYPPSRDDAGPAVPWADVYAPPGFQPLHRSFNVFVAERFCSELKRYLHSYVELYTFGAAVLERSVDGMVDSWELDEDSRARWTEHLERRYLSPVWTEEGWVKHSLSEELLSRMDKRAALWRAIEDRHAPAEPVALEACARLLLDGVEGYWTKNKADLSGAFRQAFLTGAKVAYTVSDDGKLSEVLRDWWQGGECTRLLHAGTFASDGGVLLERLGMAVETPGGASSVEERVAGIASRIEVQSEGPGAAVNEQRAYELLKLMVDDGSIPLESHTAKEVIAKFRSAHPDDDVSGRGLDQAVARLMLDFPELKAPRGRPRK